MFVPIEGRPADAETKGAEYNKYFRFRPPLEPELETIQTAASTRNSMRAYHLAAGVPVKTLTEASG